MQVFGERSRNAVIVAVTERREESSCRGANLAGKEKSFSLRREVDEVNQESMYQTEEMNYAPH